MTDRRLAAILVTDISGYSRLMHEDEAGTHARVSQIMTEVAEGTIAAHGGRIVKGTGDGFLAEFPSAVSAGRCALAFQSAVAAVTVSDPIERRLVFRVGIHLGEIIAEPSDIFGDGVNIAVRLCDVAKPGEIVLSAAVYDNLRGRIDCEFEDHGEERLKNIDGPVRVYRLLTAEEAGFTAPGAPTSAPEIPSLVVLPFQNLSADPEQEFLANGMVEDISTALSHFRSLFVIARNSALAYKGKVMDIRRIRRELNVRYVLEGSVRRIGNRIRIASQLIQVRDLTQIWADRYDCDYADIFSAQDRITAGVAAAIEPAISVAEYKRAARKLPDSLDAWEAYHRGLWHHAQSDAESNARAQILFRRAADLDPNFSPAFQGLVYCIMDDAVLYLRHTMSAALELAEPLARKAVVLNATDAGAYIALAYIHFGRGNLSTSLAAAEQALELNPNCAGAYWSKSGNLVYLGRYAEAVEAATNYLRLSPRDLRNWRVLNHLTVGRYLTGDYAAAIEAANQALRLNPNQPLTSRWLVAALGQLGRVEEALQVIAQAGATLAPVTFDSYALTRGNWLRPEAHAMLLEGLHKAGWSPATAASQSAAEAG